MTAPRCPACLRVADLDQSGRIVPHARPPLGAVGVPIQQWVPCDGRGREPAGRRETAPRAVLDQVANAVATGRLHDVAGILRDAGYPGGGA